MRFCPSRRNGTLVRVGRRRAAFQVRMPSLFLPRLLHRDGIGEAAFEPAIFRQGYRAESSVRCESRRLTCDDVELHIGSDTGKIRLRRRRVRRCRGIEIARRRVVLVAHARRRRRGSEIRHGPARQAQRAPADCPRRRCSRYFRSLAHTPRYRQHCRRSLWSRSAARRARRCKFVRCRPARIG